MQVIERISHRLSLGTSDRHGGDGDERDDVSNSPNEADIDSKTESNVHTGKGVETFPDSENEFHEVIRNQNWDLLEILLKEYDYKKYIKPKEQKKPPRKLRVAKYLPDVAWKKEVEVPQSPLHGLDALGRAPLHLGCLSPCPDKPLLRLLFCARDLASVPDATGSLPIHLAVTHDHSVDVIDKLIRAYYQGATQLDASGRTPLMWAIEMMRQQKTKEKLPAHHTYWAYPRSKEAAMWQMKQTNLWRLVSFMLENRKTRRQKMIPVEYRRITIVLGLAAPPGVVSFFLELAKSAMKSELTAGPSLSTCISRQYPLDILEKIIDACPMDFAKEYTDGTRRGVVAAHYRIGCIAHQEDASDHNSKRESFRMIMQNLANAAGNLQAKFTPGKSYQVWWEKLKFLINLWGTHTLDDDDASHDDFDMDDLLLHNALNNSDVPPSLIRLLATLRPHATDLEHPKSTALPIHLACRVWRYKLYPPRKGEKESHMDKVTLQLLEGDFSRTRKRYRDRLPIHHAIAAGHHWKFIKPLVVHDRKSLHIRDPMTKLYPFQLAASYEINFDMPALTRRKFTNAEWNDMRDHQKEDHINVVSHYYDLGQLSLIYEILRHDPAAVSHDSILRTKSVGNLTKSRRTVVVSGLAASEEVALTAQIRVIRSTFGLGPISGHFIAWAYENTRRGWKTHRSNFGVLKEAIMDGFIASTMDEWWRKLKVLIWSDCPWESTTIPHRDDFLLHAALCNPDTSPWIVNLIVECFPRSASIPLPGSEGCYPLHIACITARYLPQPFEFANKKTVIGMIMQAYPDAALLKWRGRLPLHLALAHSKGWEEINYLAEEEPIALAIVDPEEGFFPFQLMAVNRPFTSEQKKRFEMLAQKDIGTKEWKSLTFQDRVDRMRETLEQHEMSVLAGVWELLRRNSTMLSSAIHDHIVSGSRSSTSSGSLNSWSEKLKTGSSQGDASAQSLSMASIRFLKRFRQENKANAAARRARMSLRTLTSSESSISNPSLWSSSETPSTGLDAKRQPQIETKKLGGSSRSVATEGSLIDPFLGKPFRLQPVASKAQGAAPDADIVRNIVSKEVGENDLKSPSAVFSNQKVFLETSSITLDTFESSEEGGPGASELYPMGRFEYPELCRPRPKDILLIRNGSAHVVTRSTVLPYGSIEKRSRKGYWAEVLQQMGEEVALSDIYSVRHEHEQRVISSALIEGTTVVIDEDDMYVWILCGERSCRAVENYDIEAAISAISSFLDATTGVWFEELSHPRCSKFSDEDDSHRILSWILAACEKPIHIPNSYRFLISHSMLREAFAHGSINATDTDARPLIEKSTRKLCFEVAKLKMEAMLPQRKFIGVRYFVARRVCFQRQRLKFKKKEKAIKFMKSLRKKQRRAGQFKFDAASTVVHTPPPLDPLLTAAVKAESERDGAQSEGANAPATILNATNQPTYNSHAENGSLQSADSPEDEQSPPRETPILAATIKVKEENEGRSGLLLLDLNQPRDADADFGSLAPEELFDPRHNPTPTRPFLAAALKAKENAEEVVTKRRQASRIDADIDYASLTRPLQEEPSLSTMVIGPFHDRDGSMNVGDQDGSMNMGELKMEMSPRNGSPVTAELVLKPSFERDGDNTNGDGTVEREETSLRRYQEAGASSPGQWASPAGTKPKASSSSQETSSPRRRPQRWGNSLKRLYTQKSREGPKETLN